nr:hypothetical protein Iba_chr01aCG16010 [Ipomoea batatas]GMC54967.1 hypothetical protein Iba_chr01eCG2950 [Ipomoea batatas]
MQVGHLLSFVNYSLRESGSGLSIRRHNENAITSSMKYGDN